MTEARISDLPSGVWFWRKDSESRWFVEGEGYIGRVDAAVRPQRIDLSDERVLIDPNWCAVCFQQMPWPPGTICGECGNVSQDGVSLEEFRSRIGAWAGIDPAIVHL